MTDDQDNSAPKFPFLKKGQGIARFGNISYKKPELFSKPEECVHMSEGGNVSDVVESSLCETREFELIERACDSTLPNHSQLFRQWNKDNKHSSPRIVEYTDDKQTSDTHVHNSTAHNNRSGETSFESGSISSVATSQWPVPVPPKINDQPNEASAHPDAGNGTHTQQHTLTNTVQPNTALYAPRNYSLPQNVCRPAPSVDVSPMLQRAATMRAEEDGRLKEMLSQVTAIMHTLNNDYTTFQNHRDTLKQTAADLEGLKEAKQMQLADEKRQFEQLKAAELEDIRLSRESVLRQKNAMEKRESERIIKLKAEVQMQCSWIVDLQNDVCERDSRISAQRAKIRQCEEELGSQKDKLSSSEDERDRLRDRCVSLETANAQLRLQLSGQGETLKQRAHREVSPSFPPNLKSAKSVRFEVGENRGPFMRTEHTNTQTSFLVPETGQGAQTHKQTTVLGHTQTPQEGVTVVLERRCPDGGLERHYGNGTVLRQSADETTTFMYANGDTRVVGNDGTETYTYAASGMSTVTYSNGTQVVKHSDGRQHTHTTLPDGAKQTQLQDGTLVVGHVDGAQTCTFPDGSKEYRCKQFKLVSFERREWPSGDVKIIYLDGSEETRYCDGRVRIKDTHKNVIRDGYTNDK